MAAFMIDKSAEHKVGDTAGLIRVSTVQEIPGIDGVVRPKTVRQRVETGIKLQLTGTGRFVLDEEVLEYQIDGVPCPTCGTPALESDFKTNNTCPQCGKDALRGGPVWISIV